MLRTRCKDLSAMATKSEHKKKGNFKSYRKSNKELNALIENNAKLYKSKKRRKIEKETHHFWELQFLNDESKKSVSSVGESVEITSSNSE